MALGREADSVQGELAGAFSECLGETLPGSVEVSPEGVAIKHDDGGGGRWSHLELTAVQATSSSLQLSLPGDQLVQLGFPDDSPKRWEDLLRRLITEAYRRAGHGPVVEFQPRIVTRPRENQTASELLSAPVRHPAARPDEPQSGRSAHMPGGHPAKAPSILAFSWYFAGE